MASSGTPTPTPSQAAGNPAAPAQAARPEPARSRFGFVTPVIVILLAAAVVFTITRNWDAWGGGRAEQVTDDAYVRGDLTPLSTKVARILKRAIVSDFHQ